MKTEEVLHFYFGQDIRLTTNIEGNPVYEKLTAKVIEDYLDDTLEALEIPDNKKLKLILRLLSDMTEDEALHLAYLVINSKHLTVGAIEKDEIDIELVKDDGGNMLDADIEVYIEINVRRFQGYLVIGKDNSISLYQEEEEFKRIDNIALKINYLLKQGFDLFGLIESGQAIDRTTLNQKA